jgi:hypothetical protein
VQLISKQIKPNLDMKFKDLYERGLDRKVNPAVSASDLSEDTVLTEIVEYVFHRRDYHQPVQYTDQHQANQGSHVGIWINGYYGSGKSHFLKYASYCLVKQIWRHGFYPSDRGHSRNYHGDNRQLMFWNRACLSF